MYRCETPIYFAVTPVSSAFIIFTRHVDKSIGEKPRSKGLKFIFRGIDAPFPEPEITVGHRAFSDQITVCPTKCSIGRARARARLDQTIMRSLLVAVTIESEPPQKFRVSELNMAEIFIYLFSFAN